MKMLDYYLRSATLCSVLAFCSVATCFAQRLPADETSLRAKGHEYVDLDLPSGTLWATCNVGASSPEEFGDYFAWGETSPYYASGHSQDDPCVNWVSGKFGYTWQSYRFYKRKKKMLTKYFCNSTRDFVDEKKQLDLVDDVAHVRWGGDWVIPSSEQFQELCDTANCTWTWCMRNGISGSLVTSNRNGQTLFLPATGCRFGSSLSHAGIYGYYWSRNLYISYGYSAYYMSIDPNHTGCHHGFRNRGRSIRPVMLP